MFLINADKRKFFDTYKEAYEYMNNNALDCKILHVMYLGNDNVVGRDGVLQIFDLDTEEIKKYTQIPSPISSEKYDSNVYYELYYVGPRQLYYVPHEGSLEDIYLALSERGVNVSERIPLKKYENDKSL